MARWPWFTMALAVAAVINPLGLDIIHAAFFSGEQLSRSIWQPVVYCVGLIVLEWRVRKRRAARRKPA